MEKLGPRAHMVAICQPSVSALAAAAVMCEDAARTAHLARSRGEVVPLEQEDIDALYHRYQNVYGQR